MTTVEIVLIIIGVIFLVVSFLMQERLTGKDLDRMAQMSDAELKAIVQLQTRSAREQIGTSVEDMVEEALIIAKRGLEKETNQKIMAVSEYSDTIFESMNKTHNEIMFLYSMLNDKHMELTEFANSLNKKVTKSEPELSQEIKFQETDFDRRMIDNQMSTLGRKTIPNIVVNEIEEEPESLGMSKNEQILALYKQGKDGVEIAKELGCGFGEVKLVLGLFKEEQTNAI